MQMIDWQDFVVVETIDFFDEQLPAPQFNEINKADEVTKEIGPQANPPRTAQASLDSLLAPT